MVAEFNWRDGKDYQYLEDLDPAELAWEFLRRNPEYEREIAASDPTDPSAATALTTHWGLRFPDTADATRHRRRNLLEPRRRPERPHPHPAGHARDAHTQYQSGSGQRPNGG